MEKGCVDYRCCVIIYFLVYYILLIIYIEVIGGLREFFSGSVFV